MLAACLMAVAGSSLLMAACRDTKISSYRIPKEKDLSLAEPAVPPVGAMPSSSENRTVATVPQADGADLIWTVPWLWKAKPPSAMRKGSYTVGDADAGEAVGDLSITAFPGDVGGERANVNRWRGQLQLEPLAEAELSRVITRVTQNGLNLSIVDFVGGPASHGQRMIGVIVPFKGATWFFKFTGPEAVVAKAKPAFIAFLETVKPASDPVANASVSALPIPADTGISPIAMTNTVVPPEAGPGLAWTAPTRWQSKPGSVMRKGSYIVAGEGGVTADLSITAFPGAVGGELANTNRWRGQLGLPPLAESELEAAVTRLNANDLAFTLVDGASTGADAKRILGAMVPYQGAMWFFKLTGPDALVAREKPVFVEFLQTVRPSAGPRP